MHNPDDVLVDNTVALMHQNTNFFICIESVTTKYIMK